MLRLFLFLFLLPWWTYLPLAAGVAYLTEQSYRAALVEAVATPDAPKVVEASATAPAPQAAPMKMRGVGWLIAFGVVMFGLVRRVMTRAEAASRNMVDAFTGSPISGDTHPATTLATSIAPNSPLGRIAARRAPQAVATPSAPETPMPPASDEAPEPETATSGLDAPFLAKLGLGMVAVGLIGYNPLDAHWLMSTALPLAAIVGLWVVLRRMARIVPARIRRGTDKPSGHGQRA